MNLATGTAAIGLLALILHGPADAQTTTLSEDQKLLGSVGQASENFGTDVAADGDVAVVGTCGADPAAEIAYVYRHNGSLWVEEQILVSSRPDPDEGFGCDVDVFGDVIVVGAPGDPLAGTPTGSAYVFRFDGSVWQQEQRLRSRDAETGAFGADVAIHGNVIVVGASWLTSHCVGGGFTCGAAYVFRFNGTRWVKEQMIVASDLQTSDSFGDSVDVSGDTIVVGSPGEDAAGGAGSDFGAAYVFSWDGAVWSEDQKIVASDASLSDHFGQEAVIDGTVVAIGARKQSAPGVVYLFQRFGVGWTETAILAPEDTLSGDFFGFEIDLKGDLLAVGAVSHDHSGGAGKQGAGYLYRFDGNSWVEARELVASDAAQVDQLGGGVALTGSLGLFGATGDDDLGNRSGSVYSFDLNVLSLDFDPEDLPVGTTVSIRTSGGGSGMPGMLFLVDVGGVPIFQPVAGPALFNAEGVWTLTGTVVSSLPTTDATFRALGLDAASVLIVSNDATVHFP